MEMDFLNTPPTPEKNAKIQESIYQEWNVWGIFSQLRKDLKKNVN